MVSIRYLFLGHFLFLDVLFVSRVNNIYIFSRQMEATAVLLIYNQHDTQGSQISEESLLTTPSISYVHPMLLEVSTYYFWLKGRQDLSPL